MGRRRHAPKVVLWSGKPTGRVLVRLESGALEWRHAYWNGEHWCRMHDGARLNVSAVDVMSLEELNANKVFAEIAEN